MSQPMPLPPARVVSGPLMTLTRNLVGAFVVGALVVAGLAYAPVPNAWASGDQDAVPPRVRRTM